MRAHGWCDVEIHPENFHRSLIRNALRSRHFCTPSSAKHFMRWVSLLSGWFHDRLEIRAQISCATMFRSFDINTTFLSSSLLLNAALEFVRSLPLFHFSTDWVRRSLLHSLGWLSNRYPPPSLIHRLYNVTLSFNRLTHWKHLSFFPSSSVYLMLGVEVWMGSSRPKNASVHCWTCIRFTH